MLYLIHFLIFKDPVKDLTLRTNKIMKIVNIQLEPKWQLDYDALIVLEYSLLISLCHILTYVNLMSSIILKDHQRIKRPSY